MFDVLGGLVVIVLFLLLVYLGWRSTEVTAPVYAFANLPGTALLSSSGLHRSSLDGVGGAGDIVVPVHGNLLNRLVDQIQASNLRNRRGGRGGLGVQTRAGNSVEEIEYNEGNILMTHVLWASNESGGVGDANIESEEARLQRHTEYLIDGIENEGGPEAIIREMDRDLNEDGAPLASEGNSNRSSAVVATSSGTAAEEVQNCTNENNENVNKQAVEGPNAIDLTDNATSPLPPPPTVAIIDEDPWKIKLKYLNDEMRVVEAKPSQTLGEFKKLNFVPELSANKLVRLVFNGKVLQPDGTSLRSCGLFENCVVHCLVHNMQNLGGQSRLMQGGLGSSSFGGDPAAAGLRQRIYPSDVIAQNNPEPTMGLLGPVVGPVEQQQPAEQSPGNYSAAHLMLNRVQQWLWQQWNRLYNWRFYTELLLLAFTITTIYLRIRYADLFTATSTIGLILVSVMILGISVTINML